MELLTEDGCMFLNPYFTICFRFMLGYKVAAGIPVSEICKEAKISRTYIYQQKADV